MTAREPVFKDETITSRLRALYGRYGYSQFRMRKFEEYDLYVRNKSFLISDHVITFTEPSGKLMALKPDVTLSIVKNSKETPGYVQKVYYKESVYRVDKDSDTFKEITQVGLECVGDIDDYSIFEVLLLAVESLREIGEEFVLDISHLGIVSAVLDEAGVTSRLELPQGIEGTVRVNDTNRYVFLLNHTQEEKEIVIEKSCVNILTGDTFEKGDVMRLNAIDVAILKEERN